MRGLDPTKIPELVKGDVDLVKKEARFILLISSDGNTVRIVENISPRLDVFAIIGPAQGFGRNWDEALLAEIGIARTRPYNEAKGLSRRTGQLNVHQRRKWFNLSERQYRLVAPIVFGLMGARAEKRISFWKAGSTENRFLIRTHNVRWHNSRKKLSFMPISYAVPAGIRFSVSLKDEFFVRDIFWAELNLNEHLKKQINGLARFISKRLNWYNMANNYRGKRKITTLLGYQEVKGRLEICYLNKFPHLMIELAKKLEQDQRIALFFPRLAEVLQWQRKDSEENKLASLALQILHPKERLCGIQILVTADLSKRRDFITFEVQK